MTKAETHKLLEPHFRARIARGKKTPENRHIQGLLFIGYIQCLRDLVKLCRPGNEASQVFADLCQCKETAVVAHLRKL